MVMFVAVVGSLRRHRRPVAVFVWATGLFVVHRRVVVISGRTRRPCNHISTGTVVFAVVLLRFFIGVVVRRTLLRP